MQHIFLRTPFRARGVSKIECHFPEPLPQPAGATKSWKRTASGSRVIGGRFGRLLGHFWPQAAQVVFGLRCVPCPEPETPFRQGLARKVLAWNASNPVSPKTGAFFYR